MTLKSVFLDIFRCQKYVKKGYMEMRKWIYLVSFWAVLGRSILHYSQNVSMKINLVYYDSKE